MAFIHQNGFFVVCLFFIVDITTDVPYPFLSLSMHAPPHTPKYP